MKIELTGQSIIITGAGRGIGRDLAFLCADAEANVVLTARSEDQLVSVREDISKLGRGRAVILAADLNEPATTPALVKLALEEFGKIDVLVNNAGVNSIGNLVMSKEESWREVFELNVFAVFRLTQAVLRQMIRAKYGRVINISSVAAKTGAAYASSYAASKAAILGFTKSIARETASIGITVNAICPWHVDTELVREAMAKRAKMFGRDPDEYLKEIESHSPQKQLVRVREVSALALYLMSAEARALTGQSFDVDGGTVMD